MAGLLQRCWSCINIEWVYAAQDYPSFALVGVSNFIMNCGKNILSVIPAVCHLILGEICGAKDQPITQCVKVICVFDILFLLQKW